MGWTGGSGSGSGRRSGLARNLRIGQLIAVEGMSCIVMAVLYGGRWR